MSDGEACGDGDHMEETELSHSNGPNSPNTETSEDDAEIGHSEGDNVEANEPVRYSIIKSYYMLQPILQEKMW